MVGNNGNNQNLPWFLRSGWRVFLVWFLILLLPFIAVFQILKYKYRKSLEEEIIHRNKGISFIISKAVEEHFTGIKNYLELFIEHGGLRECYLKSDTSCVVFFLKEILNHNNFLNRAFITDVEGTMVLNYPYSHVENKSCRTRDWFMGISQTDSTYISEIYKRFTSGNVFVVAIATPIRNKDGKTTAYFVVQQTVEDLMKWIIKLVPTLQGNIMIIDHRGNILSRDSNLDADSLDKTVHFPELKKLLKNGTSISAIIKDPFNRMESIIRFNKIEKMQWYALFSQPLKSAMLTVEALYGFIVFVFGVCFLLVLLTGSYFIEVIRMKFLNIMKTRTTET